MSSAPVICFGQQPCGFFPRRFLFAKIQTARRLQKEIGGEIVFFCHDSDHDPRETQTILRHRKTNEPAMLNFAFENKIQRKFSPLYLKQIAAGWQDKTMLQLPNYVGHPLIDIFKKVSAANVADFCLEMYRGMGLLDGIRVVRSSDPAVRRAACDVPEFFVDVPYEGEIVRARFNAGAPSTGSACADDFSPTSRAGARRSNTFTARRRQFLRHAAGGRVSARNKSARRATRGCAGCNRSCIARITLPGRANRLIFAAKKRRKSLL